MARQINGPPDPAATIYAPEAGRRSAQKNRVLTSERPAQDRKAPPGRGPVDATTWRKQPQAVPIYNARMAGDRIVQATLDIYQDNPILALAAPIFGLLAQAQQLTTADADALHEELLQALHTFEMRGESRGLSLQEKQLALYALAATADDCVLHTSWGNESDWPSKTLVSALFKETWGGERFFVLLGQMMAAPHTAVEEIELYYYCLQFGFEGKYRLASNGASELMRIKEEIYTFLRRVRGAVQPEMSPSWRTSIIEPRAHVLPLTWILGAGLLVCLFALYLGYMMFLSRQATIAADGVRDILSDPMKLAPPPPPPVDIPVRNVTSAPPSTTPAATVQKPAKTPLEIVSGMLEKQQQEKLLTVLGRNGTIVIRTSQELFASASTTLRTPYPDVMTAVADALKAVPGPVEVVGYTDSIPINNATYPNNVALSTARAEAVERVLATHLGSGSRLSSQGKGAADPIASNATAQGREENRRVEIVLTPQ